MNGDDISLRERKKIQTRREIHRAALELAIERGPGNVTADDIAAAAGISPRTFFNYYETKDEAFVGGGGRAPETIADDLRARPTDEPIVDSLHAIFRRRLQVLLEDVESWRLRRELAARAPELGRAMLGSTAQIERRLVEVAVERAGSDDLTVVIEVYRAMAAVRAALWAHGNAGLRGDLLERVDESFALLRPQPGRSAADARPSGRSRP
ncbi:TetR/AcrR family transcriptional regulator [Blastococcus sp. Marseille-P5729]|uniref:TetR/AcrR family transcriptional regulator n=1 Tax=Blastococcus sp. Marseille-P5729 TaxID=2086582 RepID=UPI00131C4DF7|nr:TetR family transcriptional regulator [Blastococcus sp. Marseille-P5729]